MNLKNKFRILRKQDGFTLVELIVVIAIIAVLGGVAVPAYSGYIEKADRAADAQLLADVNKAFAAACMVKGVDNYNAGANNPSITDGKIDAITIADDANNEFDGIFRSFFDNEGAFKKTNSLIYSLDIGGFKDPQISDVTHAAYGNGFVQLTAQAIAALKDSTFIEKLTSQQLLDQVDNVTNVVSNMGKLDAIFKSDGFALSAAKALGIDITGKDATQIATAIEAKKTELAKKAMLQDEELRNSDKYKGMTDEQYASAINALTNTDDDFKKASAKVQSNALVLYTAQETTKLGAEGAKELLNGVTSAQITANIESSETATNQKGMNQAALAYAMYYAYVNSDQCTDQNVNKNPGAAEVINALDQDKNFQKYLTTPQAEKDMEGYLAAMDMINSSTSSPEAVENLMINNFNDPELVAILTQSVGK